jgi:hypothetical protein
MEIYKLALCISKREVQKCLHNILIMNIGGEIFSANNMLVGGCISEKVLPVSSRALTPTYLNNHNGYNMGKEHPILNG